MFCHKCGSKALEGSEFCHKCGAKLIADADGELQQPEAAVNAPVRYAASASPNSVPSGKKKIWVLALIPVCALITIVVLILVFQSRAPVDEPVREETPRSEPSADPSANSEDIQRRINLNNTFVDEVHGIEFGYPGDWAVIEKNGIFEIATIISPGALGSNARLDVSIQIADMFYLFSGNPDLVEDSVKAHGLELVHYRATSLNGFPAWEVKYSVDGGDSLISLFLYRNYEVMYQILAACPTSKSDTYEPFFEAIIESYVVTASSGVHEPETGDQPADTLLTADDAYRILEKWLSAYPDLPTELEDVYYGYKEYTRGDDEYYICAFTIIREGMIEILVNKKTGEMFHYASPGNNFIEPIDEWFDRVRLYYG